TTDVEAVQAVIPTLDRPTRIDRTLRLLRVPAGKDGAATLARCIELYELQVEGSDPNDAVNASLDAESGTITVIGSPSSLDRFAAVLRSIESAAVQRETRQVRCQHARPGDLAETLRDLSARMKVRGAPAS